MGPVSALLLTICLANLVSSQSTEMNSGQCEHSNAVIYDIAEEGRTTGADVRRLREELAGMKMQQQHLYTVIEEIRQMLMGGNSTTVNVSSEMLKENHSTSVTVSMLQCSGEFVHRNSNLSSCYYISTTKLSWNDAAEDCVRHGSYLAEIQSEEENDYLESLLMADAYHWIGGNDIVTESEWVWKKSGERFTYTNWLTHQPDGERMQNCLMLEKGKWRDNKCSVKDVYICEMKSQ